MKVKNKLIISIVCAVVCAFLFVTVVFAETSYSDFCETSTRANMKNFGMKTLLKTSGFSWVTGEGIMPKERYETGLAGYVLRADATDEYTEFITSADISIDVFNYRKVCFVIRLGTGFDGVANDDGKLSKADVILTISSGDERLVCRGDAYFGVWSVLEFDIGSWRERKNITGFSIKIEHGDYVDLENAYVEFSGPYVDNEYYNAGSSDLLSGKLDITGADYRYIKGLEDREALRLELVSSRVVISGQVIADYSADVKNALRIVMTNASDYDSVLLQYTYIDKTTGRPSTASKKIDIKAQSNKLSYIVKTEPLDRITNFSLAFDGKKSGNAIIYKIEAVSLGSWYEGNEFGDISSCVYLDKQGKIRLKGSVFHNFLISHNDFTLYCYKVMANETISEVLLRGDAPVGKAKMSSEFSFELDLKKLGLMPLVSSYAVVAEHEGERFVISAPTFVSFGDNKLPSEEPKQFKGISTSDTSLVIDCGAESAVVDLYLDKLTNQKNSGYLYSVAGTRIYYDSSYIDMIDRQIKNLYGGGCKVYLRLLISSDADTSFLPYASPDHTGKAEFLAVNISERDALLHFHAAVDFICKRYLGSGQNMLRGLILGSSLDLRYTRNYSDLSTDISYTESTARTFNFMARTALAVNSELEFVLPISDNKSGGKNNIDSDIFLTSLCRYFEGLGGLKFTVMLESTHNPFDLTRGSFAENPLVLDENGQLKPTTVRPIAGVRQKASNEDSKYYGADSLYIFERLLDYLEAQSSSAPKSYIYYWTPNVDTLGNALNVAYTYNYYALAFSSRARSFVMSIDEKSDIANARYAIINLIKYINTSKNKNGELTSPALASLGLKAWSDLIDGFSFENMYYTELHSLKASEKIPEEIRGSYSLWDFSTAFGTLNWSEGNHCLALSQDATAPFGKALRAVLEPDNKGFFGYSDFVYTFDYAENISFAPYVEFVLQIGENGNDDEYDVIIQIGNLESCAEFYYKIIGGKPFSIVADMSGLELAETVENIRIRARRISGTSESFPVYLHRTLLHSTQHDNDALDDVVERARAEARNIVVSAPAEEKHINKELIFTVVLIIAVSIFMASFYDRKEKTKK